MKVNVTNLKRYFGKTKAVDDISFTLSAGQIVGFVGPNGAGKTTTMKIMSTIDEPTSGDVEIEGVSVVQYPEKARRLVGFMPDSLPTHRDVTVDDYLDFFARSFGINSPKRRKIIDGIEEFTNLIGIRDKFLKALSKGMKQRVSLARALIHDPSVLILDEPAAGLDPRARIELRELLKALSEQGKCILVSSHILSELSEICNSAVIIEKGRLLTAGNLDDISRKSTHCSMLIRAKSDNAELYKFLIQIPKVLEARILPNGVEVDYDGKEEETGLLISSLIQAGFSIIEMKHLKADLEEVFMNVTKGDVG